ncbi:MAG TPA: alpha/beta hydrolase [Candidatus Methanomethylophilaceae archaeon]|nr:alpha/beta hydrolase [Candidatus Methanomethylophilaceae archaeon]
MPFVRTNGADISYSVKGSGDPIVLLAGFGSAKDFWDQAVSELSIGYTVITLDNRGSGETVYENGFTIDDMADDVIQILDGLSLNKAHVLGWSMGSQIAQSLAIRYPERVSTLALVSSYFRRPERSSFMLRGMIAAVEEGMPVKYLSVPLKAMTLPESYFSIKKREVSDFSDLDVKGLAHQIDAVDKHDTEMEIHRIKAPVLSIHGMEDYMVPVKMGDELSDRITNCDVLRLEDEGHNILPSRYMGIYESFVNTHGL